ncbi:FtsW/RodA/SpoVE family cell cycle protein [Mycolicibacterium sphagni]|uniref:Cell division protein FtsW n=1 Tax=Mycolicibacterium sphagni TaxID=1786 RepID=A0A255DD38_9MYCO|nr:FtsW/RodA/SpoVE family cell cycle protein [Mycolicibacterium sphagni]OYN76531.1 cell division protein FtsW [Mycolicibacterium sphagni]
MDFLWTRGDRATFRRQDAVGELGNAPARARRSELALLGYAIAVTAAGLTIVTSTLQSPGRPAVGAIVVLAAALLCAHGTVRRFAPDADPVLLPVAALLNGLGLVMIYRLGVSQEDTTLLNPGLAQLMWTVVGIGAFCGVLIAVRDHQIFARYGYLCGSAGLLLLAIPAVLPAAVAEQNGAKLWIRLWGLSIEPAEFAKILLIIFMSAVLVAKRDLFEYAGTRAAFLNLPRPRDLAPLAAALIIAMIVMVFETDLGAALLVYLTFLTMVYIATARVGWVLIGIGVFAAASVVAYHIFRHVQIRVHNWVDPFADPDNTGYQMVQSMFSFATGGLMGTGLGQGQPELIPVASSDFITAAFGEELGLVGLSAVVLLYGILTLRGLRTAIAVRDSFGKLLSAGLATTLGLQVFLTVGGVTNLLPQTGLTTPWLSYGGSSLVANYVLLAIVLRVSDAARRPVRSPRAPGPALAEARTEVIAAWAPAQAPRPS